MQARRRTGNRYEGVRLGYSPQETADRLNSSKSTIYRLLAAGELLAIKQGTATLILPDSIDRYVARLPPATFGRRKLTAAA